MHVQLCLATEKPSVALFEGDLEMPLWYKLPLWAFPFCLHSVLQRFYIAYNLDVLPSAATQLPVLGYSRAFCRSVCHLPCPPITAGSQINVLFLEVSVTLLGR